MKEFYTTNNIIKLAYNDCDLFDRLEAEFAMADSIKAQSLYDSIMETKRTLDANVLSPRQSTTHNILAYSKIAMA
jgi:hypothetical protein